MQKRINGTLVQQFLYLNQLEPIAELDGAGNVVANFVYADRAHVPSLMRKDGRWYRIVSDQLGSVRLVVDLTEGTIAQRLDYDEFGRVLTDTQPGFQPFGYAGGIYDRDTGLVRFGARDYDPGTGRWTAKDPARFGGKQQNLYAYVDGDPVNRLDVNGRSWAAAAVVVGAAGLVAWSYWDTIQALIAAKDANERLEDTWREIDATDQELKQCPDLSFDNEINLRARRNELVGQFSEDYLNAVGATANAQSELLLPDEGTLGSQVLKRTPPPWEAPR